MVTTLIDVWTDGPAHPHASGQPCRADQLLLVDQPRLTDQRFVAGPFATMSSAVLGAGFAGGGATEANPAIDDNFSTRSGPPSCSPPA